MNSVHSRDSLRALSEDTKEDLDEFIEEFWEREKLGHGFTPVNPLDEIDIGKRDRSRPTFVSKNIVADYKLKLIELLKEYNDCFAWVLGRGLENEKISTAPQDHIAGN